LLALVVAVGSALALAPMDADARRFGGGKSSGMQRAAPPPTPAKPAQATPNAAPNAGAAAAAGKRSWMGPLAGLAAGLGLAALMSHLGLGEEFANILMLALLAVVAFVVIRMLMQRFGRGNAPQLASAGRAPGFKAPSATQPAAQAAPMQRSAEPAAGAPVLAADGRTVLSTTAPSAASLPADFDATEFERLAKMIFIRMQAANDTGDLNDLRQFTTPEMFSVVKLDLQERGASTQTTDVVHVDAQVLGVEQEGERQVVSVRFHGQIREDIGADATDFDEVWHLVRWGDNPSWAIAGIQQRQ
jgi:predicted lipid-binding transport protein (Tim44 family)